MIEVEFDNSQQITVIQTKLNEPFKNVINKYLQVSSLDSNNVFFIADGRQINPEEKVLNQINSINKESKKMRILVLIMERSIIYQEYEKSKDIICPKCFEPCRIKFENFQIYLYDCVNNHISNLKIKDFFDSQKINLVNIKCQKCKIKNKANCPKNEFYKCLTCNKNICLICKSLHQKHHQIINYDQKNYVCNKHNDPLIKYCTKCNKNICSICDVEHYKHKKITFNKMKLNINEMNDDLKDMKKEIDIFNNNIKDMVDKLYELMNIVNIFYEINNNIINNYDSNNKNYQILKNIKEINNNEIYNQIYNINTMNNIKNKITSIIDLYNNINLIKEINNEQIIENKQILINHNNISFNKKLSKITIIYSIDKKNNVKIFGSNFVKNNRDNCYLLIDRKRNELCDYLELNKNQKKKDTLKIELIETKIIDKMNDIFYDCNSLISLPDFDNWDMTYVTDISYMFYNCSLLISLPDISKWNTEYVTNMSYIFYYCYSLKSLPDVSHWNTENVINMSHMFYYFRSLTSLPDISKWNTTNVKDMSYMFYNCCVLKSLPDISKWNTANVKDMSSMFKYCSSLISLPNISKWNIKNVLYMNSMFNSCKSLISLPNISKWKLNKDLKKDSMFEGCNEAMIPEKFK